jgi:hypothetical protein
VTDRAQPRADLLVILELSAGALAVLAVILIAIWDAGGLDPVSVIVRSAAIVSALAGWAWMLRIALSDPEV